MAPPSNSSHWNSRSESAICPASRALPLTAANGRYFRNSARSNIQSLIATLSLSALVVHLLKPVVALVVTPVDEDGSMIDNGAILAPSFETDMIGW